MTTNDRIGRAGGAVASRIRSCRLPAWKMPGASSPSGKTA